MAASKPDAVNFRRNWTKLWIRDLHSVARHPTVENSYSFADHLVSDVDVVGVIINKKLPGGDSSKVRPVKYVLDDGTGVIECAQFPSLDRERHKTSFQRAKQLEKDLSDSAKTKDIPAELLPGLQSLARTTLSNLEKQDEEEGKYKLGDLVHVQGRLKEYRGVRNITIFKLRKLQDPNEEIGRIYELDALYLQIYNKNENHGSS